MTAITTTTFAILLGAALAPLLQAGDTIEAFGHKWTVQAGKEWMVEQQDGEAVARLATNRQPEPGKPRRPQAFAIAEAGPFSKVTMEAEVKRSGKSLIFVFAYQDDAHYNYAHLSLDTGRQVAVHNGVFHVYGGERVRISNPDGPNSLPSAERWYPVRLEWDGATGLVQVWVDGKPIPTLRAYDLSLPWGKVGMGSFNETGSFRRVKIKGTPAAATPPPAGK